MADKIYWEILDKKRQDIFLRLSFLKKIKVYLAGGTALALQIGHRTSVDFDFYSQKHFKSGEILKLFKENIPEIEIKILRDMNDTFEAVLDKKISVSLFYYDYPLIDKLIKAETVDLASEKDIAAMKIIALTQRGKRRDFVDIYYLLQIYALDQIFVFTQKKFKEFDIYNGLKGLIYFTDAEKDSEISRIKVFDRKVTWKKVKEYIFKKVRSFQIENDR